MPAKAMPIGERVRSHATTAPDRVAVRDRDGAVTYGDLLVEIDRWADVLARQGVGPGGRVGVVASRHRLMPAAALAIMSLGAAYVPMDPTTPLPRLRQMAAVARLERVLVPDPDDVGSVGALDVELILPVRRSGETPMAAHTNPPDEAAYVIFTSGTTGTPKGVVVTHRGLGNLLDHMAGEPGLAAGEKMLGLTTPAFDLSIPDVFLPLVVGATLVIVPRDDSRDGRALRRWLETERPNLVQATPSSWRLLFEAGWAGDGRLRTVCGGEAFEASLARRLATCTARAYNFYGPTETTVWSVCRPLRTDETDPVPMGRPIRGTTCTVVDDAGRPVSPGETGELLIGGEGVAAGYLFDRDHTAAAFVPDPGAPGRSRYRTGDLVRADHHGSLTFAGRRDTQVKLRGHRVELGDVEVWLRRCPGVSEAVAVLGSDGELRAAVTGATDAAAVRRAMSDLVADYMVPAAVTVFTDLPLTPNGKVDRRLLSNLGLTPARSGSIDDTRTPLEALLAQIWSDALTIDPPDVTDDFFALGGSSLDATRIVVRVAESTGIDLRVVDLFDAPSIRELARVLLDRLSETATNDDRAVRSEAGVG